MTENAARGYAEMKQAQTLGWSCGEWDFPESASRDRGRIGELATQAKLAVGRLGPQLAPHLDESLVIGRAMMLLLQMSDPRTRRSSSAREQATLATVEGLRAWIKSGPWFETAWRERVEPLREAAGHCGLDCDELLARETGLEPAQIAGCFVEAGLAFGVTPERMLPLARISDDARQQVARVIGELPEQQRTVLTFYFREHLSFPEIGELLDLGPEQLQGIYGRAAIFVRAGLMATQASGIYGEILGGGLDLTGA